MEKKNLEPNISRYLHAKGLRLGLPISGTFELTPRCNFSCPMCYVHRQRAQGELNATQWIDLARQARDAGMVFALLTGGEPFVRKDFFEIYSGMKQLGLMISINTNGSLLADPVLEKLLEDPPYRMNISLYGGCAQTYRDMCGQDAFDAVVENLKALKKAGVDVRLNLSITPYNCHDLEKIRDIARELSLPVKATAYMYPPLRVAGRENNRLSPEMAAQATWGWDTLRLSPEELERKARSVAALRAAQPGDCPVDDEPGIGCRAGKASFWLTWQGEMTPCGMMPHPVAYPLKAGFLPAWQQLRQAAAAVRTPKECAGCSKREVCGVCAAVCLTETGRFDGVPAYMCRMTDAFIAGAPLGKKEEHYED